MDSVRYFAAMLIVVIAPPLYLSWLLIHSLAAIWRKVRKSIYFLNGDTGSKTTSVANPRYLASILDSGLDVIYSGRLK